MMGEMQMAIEKLINDSNYVYFNKWLLKQKIN